jgi:hypothetical protein
LPSLLMPLSTSFLLPIRITSFPWWLLSCTTEGLVFRHFYQ